MRKNTKRKSFLHSKMRPNVFSDGGNKRVMALFFIVLLIIAVGIGLWMGYQKLYQLWTQQCEITDLSKQVLITSTGDQVKTQHIYDLFKLRPGANLATIDFHAMRRKILKDRPNIRTITIRRHLPNRVEIHIEERQPVARIKEKGHEKDPSYTVVDSEGVVFRQASKTSLLPTIYEGRMLTQPGDTLSGRSRAALQLLEVCRRDFQDLGILTVYATHPDYLVAILGNYTQAKIAWQDMDIVSARSEDAMLKQLNQLRKSIRACGARVKVWNVTIPNRATGDTKEPIL